MEDDDLDFENPVLAAVDAAEAPGAPSHELLAKFDLNDLGNGRRLLARFGSELAYTDERGWLAWNGQFWADQHGGDIARHFAHKTADALWREADTLSGIPKQQKAMRKHALQSGNSGRLEAMLKEAASYSKRVSADFDADPYLLNVANGTLCLKGDVRLKKHDRYDRLTRICEVDYRPDAPSPRRWLRFVEECQPEREMQLFLQRWLGYCITGSILEQNIAIFEGGGSNGKSTMIDVISAVMGNYAATAPIETWLYSERKSGSGPSPDLARLPGVRLVRTSEPEAGVRLSESVIKQWTGGERIITRRLNRDFFEFKPVGKLTMSLNVKPSIVGKDFGIRRRILMVPFRQTFARAPGRDFTAELLDEREGILNWLLDGWRLYQEDGLCVPEAVTKATEDYFAENDPIGQFLKEACETVPAAAASDEWCTSASDIYAGYKKWCEERNEDPKKQTSVGRRLSDLGHPAERRGHDKKTKRVGIKLKLEYYPSFMEAA